MLLAMAAMALAETSENAPFPDKDQLAKGKALYEAAGSCVACHMPNGKGQPGSIPPLAGSEWLESTDRSIAISLRGLAGPIKVNGKRYYSAMPPQLLFNDAELASILTYVNFAWGNQGEVVDASRVARARKELPPNVYTPASITKAFPFQEKALSKRNGPYKPDYDDQLTHVTEPVVYRTFMPGASPAAFAVALPGNHYYCWDAGESRLRYVWSKGGFIKGNQRHWSSNGKPVAQFDGLPYYTARSSLLKPEHAELLAKTDHRAPIYDTTQVDDFPFDIAGVDAKPRFLGVRLIDGFPQFRVRFGAHEIRETIRVDKRDGLATGVVRAFEVEPPAALTLSLTPNALAQLSASVGSIDEAGLLKLDAKQAAAFQVTITEKPDAPVPTSTEGGNR